MADTETVQVNHPREIHVTGRQQGKTTKMLEWMRAAPEDEVRVLVSHTRARSMQLLRENPDLYSWQFVSSEEMLRGHTTHQAIRGRIVLGVDDLDLVLQRLLNFPIGRISMTGESE